MSHPLHDAKKRASGEDQKQQEVTNKEQKKKEVCGIVLPHFQ
jgi:hypothetical protein